MLRVCLTGLALLAAFAVGCTRSVESPLDDESPGAPVAVRVLSPVTDWVTVGDVAMRVDKAIVQPPVVEERASIHTTKWTERELEKPALMVWIQIENRSGAKKINYNGFGSVGPHSESVSLTDEHGNTYAMQDHEKSTRRLKERGRRGPINPGDKIVTDVLCFEPPIREAATLTLTLPALTGKEDGKYQFELPAVAWKR
jgi:hypothetical protein